jgi:hypothetical protein
MKMDVKETWSGGVHLFHLAQDTDRWPVLVYTVMNFGFSYMARNFLTS